MARRYSPELLVGLLGSLAVHALWLVGEASASSPEAVWEETEVTLEVAAPVTEPDPAPDPEPEPEPEPEPAPSANARMDRGLAPAQNDRALPSAAKAGQTLTAPEEPSDPAAEVADFTMVQGDGDGYVGGTTAARGESETAVRGQATNGRSAVRKPTTSAAAKPSFPAQSGPDRSRAARPQSGSWSCSHLFPSDPGAPNFAAVMIVVTVRADGSPRSIQVTSDPGHGFGAAARTCALGQRYLPALDRNGNPVTSVTPPITVRFSR